MVRWRTHFCFRVAARRASAGGARVSRLCRCASVGGQAHLRGWSARTLPRPRRSRRRRGAVGLARCPRHLGGALSRRCAAFVGAALATAATRPRGEPAWHRRARRERGHARALLRVAAAQDLLGRHHSAQRPSRSAAAMGRRGFGGSNGGQANNLLAQLLQAALANGGGGAKGGGKGGGMQRNGLGKGGGGRGGGGAAATGRGQAPRDGDWRCPRCEFINFAYRSSCLQCDRAGAKGGGSRSAPHSAGTRRAPPTGPPRTSADAREAALRAGEPSYRVPRGGDAAGRMGPSTRTTTACSTSGAVDNTRAAGGLDANAARADRAVTAASAAGGAPVAWRAAVSDAEAHVADNGMPRRPRWADDSPPCDHGDDMDDTSDYADRDAQWEQEEEDGDDGEDGYWTSTPSPEDLRSRWQLECKAVKALERVEKPGGTPSSALQAARAARDRAEAEWRSALVPKPVSIRLGYAQRKLDKAQRAVERAEREIQCFEEEAQRRREELQHAVDAASRRRDGRQRELDDLHREAGRIAESGEPRGYAVDASDARGCKFRDDVAEGLRALIEAIDEGSAARGMANLLLAKLASDDSGDSQCQSYNICTDGEDGDGGAPFQVVTRRGRAAGGARPGQAEQGRATWTPGPSGRWNRQRSDANDGDEHDRPAAARSCDATPTPTETDADAAAATAAAVPRAGATGRGTRSREGEQPQPPAKSHRGEDDPQMQSVEADGDDMRRALKLKEEQDAAIAAARDANASFGDQASMQIAGQLYAHKVDLVRQRAAAIGVEPMADGTPLIGLAPERLNAWVKEVLAPAEAARRQGEDDKEL